MSRAITNIKDTNLNETEIEEKERKRKEEEEEEADLDVSEQIKGRYIVAKEMTQTSGE